MTYNPAEGYPRIVPGLRYDDVAAAIAWLSEAFGLREELRWSDGSGTTRLAEMRFGDAAVFLGSNPEGETLNVYVDDVDAHFRQAKVAGATIVDEPEDKPWGLRQYRADDPAGHRWEFSQWLRDVPPEEWGATPATP